MKQKSEQWMNKLDIPCENNTIDWQSFVNRLIWDKDDRKTFVNRLESDWQSMENRLESIEVV